MIDDTEAREREFADSISFAISPKLRTALEQEARKEETLDIERGP